MGGTEGEGVAVTKGLKRLVRAAGCQFSLDKTFEQAVAGRRFSVTAIRRLKWETMEIDRWS